MPRIPEFRSVVKWESPFRFLPTRIFGTSSGWSTLNGRTGRIKICHSISINRLIALRLFGRFHLNGGLGKGIENGIRAIPLGWSGLIGKCRFLTCRSGIIKAPLVCERIEWAEDCENVGYSYDYVSCNSLLWHLGYEFTKRSTPLWTQVHRIFVLLFRTLGNFGWIITMRHPYIRLITITHTFTFTHF